MAVWGVYDTGNYDFIIEYAFGDDGAVRFRLGATGYNHQDFPTNAHMHTALWRVDVDVNGFERDTAKLLVHREGRPTPLEATDLVLPFQGGKEGSQPWIGQLFTTLLVEDAAVNAQGNHFGYELVPTKRGVARHRGPLERFTESDYWVTVWNQHETGYTPPNDWHLNGGVTPDTFLVEAAGGGGKGGPQSIVDEDLVLWYMAGTHHDPHDEDRSAVDVGAEPAGLTLVHWLGFDLMPHNLFDYSPLNSPHRSECDGRP